MMGANDIDEYLFYCCIGVILQFNWSWLYPCTMASSAGPGAIPPLKDMASKAIDEPGKKQKLAPPELPPELSTITEEKNIFDRCVIGDEMWWTDKKTGEHTGPHKVAIALKYIIVAPPTPTSLGTQAPAPEVTLYKEYPIVDLSIDQLRLLLLKKLSVKGYCSATKFKCHQILAHHVQFCQFYNRETNLNSVSNLEKKLNSELRKVQAFFHPDLFEQMMVVNNLKGRVDHENGTSEKQTWSALADLYNNTDPDEGVDVFESKLQPDKRSPPFDCQ
jgi:hypothetical protein